MPNARGTEMVIDPRLILDAAPPPLCRSPTSLPDDKVAGRCDQATIKIIEIVCGPSLSLEWPLGEPISMHRQDLAQGCRGVGDRGSELPYSPDF